MDWSATVAVVAAVSAIVGVAGAIWSRRRSGQNKVKELQQHLAGIGIGATVLDTGMRHDRMTRKSPFGQQVVGTIRLAGRVIDSVNIIGVTSQYGAQYYLDFLVARPTFLGTYRKRKTGLTVKRKWGTKREAIDNVWKGDEQLAQRLNLDYGLRDKLLKGNIGSVKGGITVYPEPKREYARIRTSYMLPALELFEALDMIARHVKSWY